MNGDSRPLTRTRLGPAVDPRDDLQEGALATSVGTDDPEELTLLDGDRDTVAAPLVLVRVALERMEDVLLERRSAVVRNSEPFVTSRTSIAGLTSYPLRKPRRFTTEEPEAPTRKKLAVTPIGSELALWPAVTSDRRSSVQTG